MGKKLRLDWSVLLPSRPASPPPELEVVPATTGGCGGAGAAQRDEEEKEEEEDEEEDEDLMAMFPDHELQEKVQRILKNITSGLTGKLSDGGAKLRSHLVKLQGELDRRKLVRFQKNVGDSEISMQSETKESAESYNDSSPGFVTSKSFSQSSFALRFSRNLDYKPGAGHKRLKFINQNKCKGKGESGRQMHEGTQQARMYLQQVKMSSRQSTFEFASSFICKDRRRSFSGCNSDAKCIASHGGGSSFSHFSKRGRDSENMDSFNSKSKKDLVLLDEEDIRHIQSDGDLPVAWKEAKIYYPSRDDRNCVELSFSDMKCLDPESYLSSTIMNFYIRYLQEKVLLKSRLRGRFYFFNTYFYKKLEEAMHSKGSQTACFLKLRRWWKGVDLFQMAYIFLPIHMNVHWSLVIICIPAKEDQSGPLLLHLDSLGLHDSSLIFDVICRFIKEEWMYLTEKALPVDPPLSDEIWEELPQRIERKITKVPRQMNEYDCGVFVLYYMKRFIKDAPERLRRKGFQMFEGEWFKPEKASRLRERIQELLIKEFENARLNNAEIQSPSFPCSP